MWFAFKNDFLIYYLLKVFRCLGVGFGRLDFLAIPGYKNFIDNVAGDEFWITLTAEEIREEG